MNEAFLKELKALEFDSLTAREAVALRACLSEAVAKAESWFAGLARDFGQPAKPAKEDAFGNGRPPETPHTATPPVKTPTKRRGRPVPNLKVDLNVNRKPAAAPLAVGGADAATPAPGPQAARLFENSYVSKEGPRADVPAVLPSDHPRLAASRPSSVTPDVDMSDFAEVEQQLQAGKPVKNIFQ